MYTQKQAVDILQDACQSCKPIFGDALKRGYLYGSYARGDQHKDSDIDIMLLVDLPPEALCRFRREVAFVASELSLNHEITVSVSVKSYSQFLRFADSLPFYQNVIREGICYEVPQKRVLSSS